LEEDIWTISKLIFVLYSNVTFLISCCL
jgi:hypothetical protein